MKTNNCKSTGIVVHCCCCLEKMAAKLGLRLSLAQLIIGLWRPWGGAVKRSTSFPPCQKILDDHWSPLASMNQHPEATKSNNDCHLESSDYEIADKNHLHYFRPDVNCSYLSSFRIIIQMAMLLKHRASTQCQLKKHQRQSF